MGSATRKQKSFLKTLGHNKMDGLSVSSASELIDKYLAREKAQGKTFPCPYCKEQFSPRPKRKKKCPHCEKMIFSFCGEFYTASQYEKAQQREEELENKEWLRDCWADNREHVQLEWQQEKEYRREVGEALTAGFLIQIGPECRHASHLNGLLVALDDAKSDIKLLPPYDDCHSETCECDFEGVSPSSVPRGTRIAERTGKPSNKRKARHSSNQLRKPYFLYGLLWIGIAIALGMTASNLGASEGVVPLVGLLPMVVGIVLAFFGILDRIFRRKKKEVVTIKLRLALYSVWICIFVFISQRLR